MSTNMHFLRFGSSIPGPYWGCCAADIIQYFSCDPDGPASIQVVSGDGGQPLGDRFLGLTNREVFKQRLRIDTFNTSDMPNHAFFAIITESQINSANGKKWLEILKEHGFEFVRTVDNSVYSGASTIKKPGQTGGSPHKNHIFMLVRNIGAAPVDDPYTPPKQWTDMESVGKEAWEFIPDTKELTLSRQETDLKVWNNLPPKKFYTRKEVEAAGVPVTLAGKRSRYPEQTAAMRENLEKTDPALAKSETKAAPFAAKKAAPSTVAA